MNTEEIADYIIDVGADLGYIDAELIANKLCSDFDKERQADKDKIAKLDKLVTRAEENANTAYDSFIEAKKETKAIRAELIKFKIHPCTGCTHEPKSCDPYPTPCGECSRWWSDNFEEKKQ